MNFWMAFFLSSPSAGGSFFSGIVGGGTTTAGCRNRGPGDGVVVDDDGVAILVCGCVDLLKVVVVDDVSV